MLATGGKDRNVCLWKYNPKLNQYEKFVSHIAHKDAVRNVLWRKPWSASDFIELFTCSEVSLVAIVRMAQLNSLPSRITGKCLKRQ
jgi:hypothetical protein